MDNPSSEEPQAITQNASQRRVLFALWNNLSDIVLLTPALRQYKALYPNDYVGILGLKRFGKSLKELLSGLTFVDQVLPELSDVRNEASEDKAERLARIEEAKQIARSFQYHQLTAMHSRPKPEQHKILYFAESLGVSCNSVEQLQTKLRTSERGQKEAYQYLKKFSGKVLLLSSKSEKPQSTVSPEELQRILSAFPDHRVLEFGQKSLVNSVLVPELDMEFSKGLISLADRVVAVDSVILQIAGAFCRPTTAIVGREEDLQAIPLHSGISVTRVGTPHVEFSDWSHYRQRLLNALESGSVSVGGSFGLDREESFGPKRPEIEARMQEITEFSSNHGLEIDQSKCFAYACTVLCAEFRPKSTILELRKCTSFFSYYLSDKGFHVSLLDAKDWPERLSDAKRFGVKSYSADIDDFHPEFANTFDLVCGFDLIDSPEKANQSLSLLARYLNPGGVLVVSGEACECIPRDLEALGLECFNRATLSDMDKDISKKDSDSFSVVCLRRVE